MDNLEGINISFLDNNLSVVATTLIFHIYILLATSDERRLTLLKTNTLLLEVVCRWQFEKTQNVKMYRKHTKVKENNNNRYVCRPRLYELFSELRVSCGCKGASTGDCTRQVSTHNTGWEIMCMYRVNRLHYFIQRWRKTVQEMGLRLCTGKWRTWAWTKNTRWKMTWRLDKHHHIVLLISHRL